MNPSIRDIKRPIPKHVITKFSKLVIKRLF